MATPLKIERVTFPDGTYATFREKVNVRGRKLMERCVVPAARAARRVRIARQTAGVGMDEMPSPNEMVSYAEEEVEAMQRFEMAGVAATLAFWTRDEPLPQTIDEVEEMDPDIYELVAAKVRPVLWDLLSSPQLTAEDGIGADGKPDPDLPTGGSNDSAAVASEPEMTQAPSLDGGPSTSKSTSGSESGSSEDTTTA